MKIIKLEDEICIKGWYSTTFETKREITDTIKQ